MENSGRVRMPDRPTPIAAITPSSSARMTTATTMTSGCSPPRSTAKLRNGSDATRKARAVIQAARNLPSTSCQVVIRVTWVVARVPASRSPLIAVPLSAGATRVPSSSTKKMMVEKMPPLALRPKPDSATHSARVTIATKATKMPMRTYQAVPRTRCRSSRASTTRSPEKNSRARAVAGAPRSELVLRGWSYRRAAGRLPGAGVLMPVPPAAGRPD